MDLIEFRVPVATLLLPGGTSQTGVAIVYVRSTEMPPIGVAILHHMLTVSPSKKSAFTLAGTGPYTIDGSGFTVRVDRQFDILFFS